MNNKYVYFKTRVWLTIINNMYIEDARSDLLHDSACEMFVSIFLNNMTEKIIKHEVSFEVLVYNIIFGCLV
jgi:flagellar biosynthesis regulator FlaF